MLLAWIAAALAAPVTLAVIGDYGTNEPGADTVAALVASWKPDLIATTGDNNYPDGGADTIDANIGKRYHAFIGNYTGRFGAGASENQFFPAPGNHDWRAPGLEPYLAYFTLPGNERYYEVHHGLVDLFIVDSDPHEPDGITYVVDGLGGEEAYLITRQPVEGSIVHYSKKNAALRIAIDETAATFALVSDDGVTIDQFTVPPSAR